MRKLDFNSIIIVNKGLLAFGFWLLAFGFWLLALNKKENFLNPEVFFF
jgi:hypothetical protein